MKWVKASERLPELGDLYFVKQRMTDTDLDVFPGTCNFYSNEWEVSNGYEIIEWLDESAQELQQSESEAWDELWDKYSYHVGSDIDDLGEVAGSSIIRKKDWEELQSKFSITPKSKEQ